MLVGAIALPRLRRRLRLRPGVVLGGAALAPLSAATLLRRPGTRAALVCMLQMYAYVAAYKMPHDDPEAQAARVRFDYPVRLDRLIGLGELPTVRLQRALHPDGWFRRSENSSSGRTGPGSRRRTRRSPTSTRSTGRASRARRS